MNRFQRCVKPVTGIVSLGREISPEGCATETRLALSERYLDLVGLVVPKDCASVAM